MLRNVVTLMILMTVFIIDCRSVFLVLRELRITLTVWYVEWRVYINVVKILIADIS